MWLTERRPTLPHLHPNPPVVLASIDRHEEFAIGAESQAAHGYGVRALEETVMLSAYSPAEVRRASK